MSTLNRGIASRIESRTFLGHDSVIVLALQTMDMEIKKETSRRNVSDNYFDISRRKLFTPRCTNLFHISLAILGNNSFFFFFFSWRTFHTEGIHTKG